jgi:hypothetical protein
MADTAVLKEFLVSLGWKVDETSHSKFTNTIVSATKQIVAFSTAVEAAALLVINRVAAMSDQLEDLYFAAQRTGASAENIRTFGFAASRLGSSVGAARQSLEAFRAFLGSAPAANGLLRSFGIDPNQDPTKVLVQFGGYLRNLVEHGQEYLARVRAEQFGIDWHTALSLMSSDFGKIQADSEATFKRVGINMAVATKQSHEFNNQLAFLYNTFDALRIKVTEVLQQRLAGDFIRFRSIIEQNFDNISDVISNVGKAFLWASEQFVDVIGRIGPVFTQLKEWWSELTPATKDLAVHIVEFAGALWVLNRALSNPISSAIGLIAGAILLLVDDYIAWKQHRDHFIDWDKWEPRIKAAIEGIEHLAKTIDGLVQRIGGWGVVLDGFLIFVAGRFALGIIGAFAKMGLAVLGFGKKLLTLGTGGGGLAAGEAGASALAENGAAAGGGLLARKGIIGAVAGTGPIGLAIAAAIAAMTPSSTQTQSQEDALLNKMNRFGDKPPPHDPSIIRSDNPDVQKDDLAQSFWSLGSTAGTWLKEGVDKSADFASKLFGLFDRVIVNNAVLVSPANAAEWGGGGGGGLPGDALGPTPPATTSAEIRSRARMLMARLQKDLGITSQAAAADAGNAAAESGIRSIPTGLVPQTTTSAFGMWQFTGPRRTARDAFARAHPDLSPEEVDIQYHEWELKNKFPQLLEKMRQPMRNFSSLAHDFFEDYEAGHAGNLQQYEAGHTAYGQAFLKDGPALGPVAQGGQTSTTAPPVQHHSYKVDTTLNVHGVQDPQSVADRIQATAEQSTMDMIRNSQSPNR